MKRSTTCTGYESRPIGRDVSCTMCLPQMLATLDIVGLTVQRAEELVSGAYQNRRRCCRCFCCCCRCCCCGLWFSLCPMQLFVLPGRDMNGKSPHHQQHKSYSDTFSKMATAYHCYRYKTVKPQGSKT